MKIARLPDGSPEIFATLQGEGPSIGQPALFLRLSLCNLHCSWCDTPYTWNWEGTPWPHQDDIKFSKEREILEISPAEIAEQLISHNFPRLVITGGEPLLQQKELLLLLSLVSERFHAVEIETNGTQLPSSEIATHVTQFNVSPKLSNSGNAPELRLSEKSLQWFAQSPKAAFKFVVANPEDFEEILSIQSRFAIPQDRILLMPEGRTEKKLASQRQWLAEKCIEHKFRFTDRLHVSLWGDTRGT